MIIYGDLASGNCLKVKYTADYLGVPYRWADIDVTKGESRTPEALRRNPMGQVPAIELDDGRYLAQSNAIIRYLARGSTLMPEDPFAQAKVDELLFWEQYSHEPYVAVCRFHMHYLGKSKESRDPQRVERGEAALDLMDKLLTGRDWFVGNSITIADIALLAYTRLAHEGGFDLARRPAVDAWIGRCESGLKLAPASQRAPSNA
jgi:glutathione S-transferase